MDFIFASPFITEIKGTFNGKYLELVFYRASIAAKNMQRLLRSEFILQVCMRNQPRIGLAYQAKSPGFLRCYNISEIFYL